MKVYEWKCSYCGAIDKDILRTKEGIDMFGEHAYVRKGKHNPHIHHFLKCLSTIKTLKAIKKE
jgi:hypothetical protein